MLVTKFDVADVIMHVTVTCSFCLPLLYQPTTRNKIIRIYKAQVFANQVMGR